MRALIRVITIVGGLALATSGATGMARAQTGPATPVSFMVFGEPAELAAYEQLVDAFETAHPTIDVQLIEIASQGDYLTRLGADFAAGTPADVLLLNYRRYAQFAARGVLEPLGPYLRRSNVLDERAFYRQALDPFRWRGELMCIPQNVSSLVVYYDRDLFRAADLADPADDWTWDDFLAAARALTRDLDGDGLTDQYGLGTEVELIRLAPFVWQNGGELVDEPTDPHRLTLDSTASAGAVQWFVDLQLTHGVVPDAVAEAAEDSESRFLAGRTAMYLNSRRGVPTYRQIEGFDWDVAPLPRNVEAAGILHSDGYCMPTAARDPEAAWTFIEFANSAEGQVIVAATGRTVPSLVAVAESEAFLDPAERPANTRVFLDTLPTLRSLPVIPGWTEIEDLATEELERAFYGTAAVDDAIRAAVDRTAPFFGAGE
jgi:multiple sugar transport system substrate-binding protein